LKEIPYYDIPLSKEYHMYVVAHELTDVGLQKFADDWNALLAPEIH